MSEEKTSVYSISGLVPAGQKQGAYLIVLSAKLAGTVGKMVKLEAKESVLGRSVEATFQIEDDGISRQHAKVTRDEDGVFRLVDMASTNGTYLNGLRVNTAPLTDGDKIQMGSHTVLKFSIQDQLEEQYQRSIYESATRDGLTRIFNKKYFVDALHKEFAYCMRHAGSLSLLMFDVDHFKRINDSHGHLAGDLVLQRVAQRLSESVRTEDLLARYGGEEFALLLRESAEERAFVCAERCRRAVDGAEFSYDGTPIRVTISVGVATLFHSTVAQPEDLIAEADKYLYRAKEGGRNRVDGKKISGP
ncbi:MAG TPA: GGDEF domain-containing protein [Myxococcaceae bacterium]|nr:GGDEF domain-containing protein [Myxococcaceae bacterium]